MSSQPQWADIDDATRDLLDLLADDGALTTEHEWECYVSCLRMAAACGVPDNVIDPNFLRVAIDGRIKPQRVGAFTHRALRHGLVEYTGRYVISNDSHGKNAGKPCRELRWIA